MLLLKKKRIYTSPKTVMTEADLEGLICTSVFKAVQVDQIHNINNELRNDTYIPQEGEIVFKVTNNPKLTKSSEDISSVKGCQYLSFSQYSRKRSETE